MPRPLSSRMFSQGPHTVWRGDCLNVLSSVKDFDCIVTDPPYGLGFMGKQWDHGVPGAIFWERMLSVAKPGTMLMAFGGTRTYHRLACAIEDAGWEIRDCIMWVYGSGFPKSHNVSKAIDKRLGAVREKKSHRARAESSGTMSGKSDTRPWIAKSRELGYHLVDDDNPVSEEATQWNGWGTALKPSWEPIIVARKPIKGSVADNVLAYGVGGINIDACRVGGTKKTNIDKQTSKAGYAFGKEVSYISTKSESGKGRYPANLVHDGSQEVIELFPVVDGVVGNSRHGRAGEHKVYGKYSPDKNAGQDGVKDTGSASRFFYCAKADNKQRRDSKHPTVKPLALCRWLIRMVCPPGGIVLDPFAGSGSIAEAAAMRGFGSVSIELDRESCLDIIKRLEHRLV